MDTSEFADDLPLCYETLPNLRRHVCQLLAAKEGCKLPPQTPTYKSEAEQFSMDNIQSMPEHTPERRAAKQHAIKTARQIQHMQQARAELRAKEEYDDFIRKHGKPDSGVPYPACRIACSSAAASPVK